MSDLPIDAIHINKHTSQHQPNKENLIKVVYIIYIPYLLFYKYNKLQLLIDLFI